MNPTHLMNNKQIAIIGGGPVGITAALLLQNKGARVTLYERDASLEAGITGGSLDIHQHTGQLALKEAGILDAFYQISWPASERMLTKDGRVFSEDLVPEPTKHFKPEIDRNDFRRLLCRPLKEGVVVWNRKLISLDEHQGKYRLHFDGE